MEPPSPFYKSLAYRNLSVITQHFISIKLIIQHSSGLCEIESMEMINKAMSKHNKIVNLITEYSRRARLSFLDFRTLVLRTSRLACVPFCGSQCLYPSDRRTYNTQIFKKFKMLFRIFVIVKHIISLNRNFFKLLKKDKNL